MQTPLARIAGRRTARLVTAAALCGCGLLSLAPLADARFHARVEGTFTMRARVTNAVNVRGEHRGQRLRRTWTIVPSGCTRSRCRTLHVTRGRGQGVTSRLTLHRLPRGGYVGHGSFSVALKCLGRTYRHGSRARYTLSLRITRARAVGGVRFARRITAHYRNRARTDSTPCPLGPSHDAARYSGWVTAGVPSPPTVVFSAQVDALTDAATFTDSSTPGARGGPLVSQLWTFGDPNSGAADRSTLQDPTHQFSAPGDYPVTLRVTDVKGLSASATETVIAPPPPAATPAAGWRTVTSARTAPVP
jgi:hypothetical protein